MKKSEKEKNKVIIEMENICKKYINKNKSIMVIKNTNIKFKEGKFYAIMGHSGSGKSTFINIVGLLDDQYEGNYKLFNKNISNLKDSDLSKIRRENIGFIFQNYELDPNLKAYENVMMPMYLNCNINKKERYNHAMDLLNKFGLKNRAEHFPKELSGGEQQRVAIARAIANNPNIIVADEPTGNLDETMEKEIFSYLKQMAEEGKCVIVVSHSHEVKKYADFIFKLSNGILVGEINEDVK